MGYPFWRKLTQDPAIFDSEGVLLVLMHWRKPGQARWVPLLDTSTLGTNSQTYWPISIIGEKFHCIILKVPPTPPPLPRLHGMVLTSQGEEKDPYFPRPLFSEIDFTIPCHPNPTDKGSMSQPTLEEKHLRLSILHSLLEDSVSSRSSVEGRLELSKKETEIDRTLLPLIQIACKDEKGSKALELVKLLRKRASLEYAGKIAVKYGLKYVADKIGDIMIEDED
jgi:chromosome transmission fidelity protein 4